MGVVLLAVTSTACASSSSSSSSMPIKRPGDPLVTGQQAAWPEDVQREAELVDRVCGTREARLFYDYEEAKQEQQKFKTIMGSVTGSVTTVGGAITGVGAYVIDSPDTMKKVTGITGIVSAGLGAVGTVVSLVVSPGASKIQSATQSLTAIDQKRTAARAALAKDPSKWSDADKEAWTKTTKELEDACK